MGFVRPVRAKALYLWDFSWRFLVGEFFLGISLPGSFLANPCQVFFRPTPSLPSQGGLHPTPQAPRPSGARGCNRPTRCSEPSLRLSKVSASGAFALRAGGLPTQQSCDFFTPNRRFLCGVTPPCSHRLNHHRLAHIALTTIALLTLP